MKQNVLILCAGIACIAAAAGAADRTWNGASTVDSNWSRSENWGGTAPAGGDALYFGGSTRLNNTNDFDAGTPFSGITFSAGAGAFALAGTGITLDGDLCNFSTSSKTIHLPLALSGDRMIFGSNAAFTVNGIISGMGGLCAAVTNTLTLTGDNTYEGTTTVSNGCRLLITHPNALGSTAGGTRVYGRTGSSLRLQGGITVDEPITLVGQIPPWINCMTAGSGSNIITGTIYK